MTTDTASNIINDIARQLMAVKPTERAMNLRTHFELPCIETLRELMAHIKGVIFPQFYGSDIFDDTAKAYQLLLEQTCHGIASTQRISCEEAHPQAEQLAQRFLQRLPEIKRLLLTDVSAVTHNDPAAGSHIEAVFCYPVVEAMAHYRSAHEMLNLGIPLLPRIITEMAHSATGIDIHPAAQIGEYFAIDHGTGVVIGETTIIGNHVMLYQGVTLGARNFHYDLQGNPINEPRHPIVEDNVTIYSNASILGRVRIGHDSVIGGNTWITHDVPAGSRIVQGREKE
ncbi:MAG: serine acetyltransferase [Bacteroidales bacterium]|nr:serine acetyltransferase [Bacteroidales bacterium]